MASAMFEKLPEFFRNEPESYLLLFSPVDFTKNLTDCQYAISEHIDRFCTETECKFHILFYGENILKTIRRQTTINAHAFYPSCPYSAYYYYIYGCAGETLSGAAIRKFQRAVVYNTVMYPRHKHARPLTIKNVLRQAKVVKLKQTMDEGMKNKINSILNSKHGNILCKFVDILYTSDE
jgi:hypothetical protein